MNDIERDQLLFVIGKAIATGLAEDRGVLAALLTRIERIEKLRRQPLPEPKLQGW